MVSFLIFYINYNDKVGFGGWQSEHLDDIPQARALLKLCIFYWYYGNTLTDVHQNTVLSQQQIVRFCCGLILILFFL